MTPALKKEAHEFMFREFGKSIWWESKDLTRAGNPQGNPPDLNAAEAKSIFHDLFTMDLVIPTKNEHGEDCFIMHQARESEWEALIKPPNFFQKHWKCILSVIGTFILYSTSLIYSTYLTKTIEKRIEELDIRVVEGSAAKEQQAKTKKQSGTGNETK